MSRVRLSEILDKCTVALFPASAHLLDPFRVLQNFKEGVFGVTGGGAGSAGSQQLFERGFNLSRFGKLHRHQFTVQTGVQAKALGSKCSFFRGFILAQMKTKASSESAQLRLFLTRYGHLLESAGLQLIQNP